MTHTCNLNEALSIFEDNLSEIRSACVANAEDIVKQYSPYAQLDIDKPITKEAIHLHVNWIHVQEKLKPILNSIKRIDSYRHYKQNPVTTNTITDMDIQRAREVDADWFIREAELNYKKVGRCPFHSDKTPSLTLMRSKKTNNFYLKCFPCSEAFDSISFVMKKHNLNFIDAVKYIIS